jgi:hypothetical protein
MTDEHKKTTDLYDKIRDEAAKKQQAAQALKQRADKLFGNREKDQLDKLFGNK